MKMLLIACITSISLLACTKEEALQPTTAGDKTQEVKYTLGPISDRPVKIPVVTPSPEMPMEIIKCGTEAPELKSKKLPGTPPIYIREIAVR